MLVLALVVVPEAAIDVVVGQVGVAIASTRLLDFFVAILEQRFNNKGRAQSSRSNPIGIKSYE